MTDSPTSEKAWQVTSTLPALSLCRYVAVADSAYLSELNNELADAFPGRVPRAGGPVPKWLLMLLGPFLGLPRDLVK